MGVDGARPCPAPTSSQRGPGASGVMNTATNTEPVTVTLASLAEKVSATCEHVGVGRMHEDDKNVMHHWKVSLRFEGRRLTVDFWQGLGNKDAPKAADVLECLLSDVTSYEYAGSFKSFAEEFGFDGDSRKAERIYKVCGKMAPKLRKLLGESFDAFSRAER